MTIHDHSDKDKTLGNWAVGIPQAENCSSNVFDFLRQKDAQILGIKPTPCIILIARTITFGGNGIDKNCNQACNQLHKKRPNFLTYIFMLY